MKNFSIVFEEPRTEANHGEIFLWGKKFANTWEMRGEQWGKCQGWALNRDKGAFDLGLPVCGPFETPESMLEFLENWYKEKNKSYSPFDDPPEYHESFA